MKRKKICEIPDEFTLSANNEVIKRKFRFELITPMFGGDAESWVLDLKNPVRGQSVKGQLRFWWRTMQNEQEAKKLLRKENELWGGKTIDSNGKASRIKSRISLSIGEFDIDHKKNTVLAKMANKYAVESDIIPSNVLFPITSDVKKNLKEIHYIKEMGFSLNISYPKSHETDVLNTLKLWTLFGGVGARTRRGTGSIYCEELLQSFQSEKDIHTFIQSLSSDQHLHQLPYPRISGLKIYAKQKSKASASEEWHSFLESYGKFRQDRKPGKSPGRSYWPEPDAIRRLTNINSTNHVPMHPDGEWFPRSAFGLPILTKFITEGDPGNTKDITLKPNIDTGERFPSPVILKVIKLSDGSVLQCAIILNQKFPDKLTLDVGSKSYPVSGDMLPFHLGYEKTKIMRKGHELNGGTIYENLAKHLGLEEVK
ncbi:MAG: type III-B CRISPR module RAMP protein Cmr1 [Desulfobacterales bacterium]